MIGPPYENARIVVHDWKHEKNGLHGMVLYVGPRLEHGPYRVWLVVKLNEVEDAMKFRPGQLVREGKD